MVFVFVILLDDIYFKGDCGVGVCNPIGRYIFLIYQLLPCISISITSTSTIVVYLLFSLLLCGYQKYCTER